jgi:hypothetical protein
MRPPIRAQRDEGNPAPQERRQLALGEQRQQIGGQGGPERA